VFKSRLKTHLFNTAYS